VLNAIGAAVVTHIEQDEAALVVAGLARRFTALVRASDVRPRFIRLGPSA
jgi:hypothetical protein